MRYFSLAIVTVFAFSMATNIASAADLKISGFSISKMKNANLCSRLGGKGTAPVITIRHSKVAGVALSVSMFDRVSSGRVINHYSTTVKSQKSGRTVVRYSFRPPCNTTGRSTSNYWVLVRAGRSSKLKLWGRYSSRKRKIF